MTNKKRIAAAREKLRPPSRPFLCGRSSVSNGNGLLGNFQPICGCDWQLERNIDREIKSNEIGVAKVKTNRFLAILGVFLTILIGQGSASAKQCFSLFSGEVTLEVNSSVTSSGALSGRVFGGGLSSCGGLSAWPIVGSAFKNNSGGITLAVRSMTVDAAGCGAVDYLVPLAGKPLSGPAQFHNDRNNVSSTTTMTQVACPKPLPGAQPGAASMTGPDAQGNTAH